MNEKRGPGRPRTRPVTIEEILATFNKLVDKKIELAIAELEDYFKEIMVELIKQHREQFHPFCDPKELDQTLRALREYWEQQRRSNDERQT